MSKHKKTVPLFIFLQGHMSLYPSVYFHFHATVLLVLLKQYLLQHTDIFQLRTYHLSTEMHDATLKHLILKC